MSSACLLHLVPLHQSSQWDFRIWAILGSGPNTKQSHKPSVDLATDDCDTSLRSRQGRSFIKSRVSAAGLLSARSLQSQGATNRLTDLWKRLREKETERGGVASWGYSLTNCKSKRMQQAGASDHNKYMWGSVMEVQGASGKRAGYIWKKGRMWWEKTHYRFKWQFCAKSLTNLNTMSSHHTGLIVSAWRV